jgi:hypothetical protein
VWKEAHIFGCKASLAYNNNDGDHGAGSGSIGMFIAPRLTHMIYNTRVIGGQPGLMGRVPGLP